MSATPRGPSTGARLAAAGRLLASAAWSAAAYLGPLLLDALLYLARLAADAVQAARIALLRRARTKAPARAAELDRLESSLRERGAGRWRAWRARPEPRRLAVRAAALGIVLILAAGARIWWRSTDVRGPAGAAAWPADTTTGSPGRPTNDGSSRGGSFAAEPPEVGPAREKFRHEVRTIAPGKWAVLWDAPVLERGGLGAWDDAGVFAPSVLTHEDPDARTPAGDAARYRMWYRGCHLALYEQTCGIGHAVSADGLIWEKTPQPVFVVGDLAQRFLLDEIAVVRAEGRYWLWYSMTAGYESKQRRATIHLATSPDGLVWKDEGQVREGETDSTVRIEHTVFYDGGRFHMWYVTRLPDDSSPVLQHLISPDGRSWTVAGATRLGDFHPSLNQMGRLLLWPAGRADFRALFTQTADRQPSGVLGQIASPDGTTWSSQPIDSDPLVRRPDDDNTELRSITGLFESGGLRLWMALLASGEPGRIGTAFRKGEWQ